MKATIILLVVVDTAITYLNQVEEALELQRADYLSGTDQELDIVWEIKRQDLSNLNWIEYGYGKDNYGLDTNWVKKDTQKIYTSANNSIHSVAYVFDWYSWTDKGKQNIWGWNLGRFYPDNNGYQVQLIRAGNNNIKAVYYTFLMELFHAIDDFYYRATHKRLEEFFNVTDFDEDIVHARHDDYEIFKYVPAIRQMKDILIELFTINNKTMVDKETLDLLYKAIFKREPDVDALGYVGLPIKEVLDKLINSDENVHYTEVYEAVKSLETWARK